jgi:hypothetical protein
MNSFSKNSIISYFFEIFEKLFVTPVKILIIIIKLNSEILNVGFELQTCQSLNPWISVCGSLHTLQLPHKDNKAKFIILYKYYMSKISELKNQLPKLRFEI